MIVGGQQACRISDVIGNQSCGKLERRSEKLKAVPALNLSSNRIPQLMEVEAV